LTVPETPPEGLTETRDDVLRPATTVTEVGDADSVKLGGVAAPATVTVQALTRIRMSGTTMSTARHIRRRIQGLPYLGLPPSFGSPADSKSPVALRHRLAAVLPFREAAIFLT
jgi:hypothetical protein